MNKLLLLILTLIFACLESSQQQGPIAVEEKIEDEIIHADTTLVKPAPLENQVKSGPLLSFFPEYQSDSITVEVSDKARYGAIEESEFIPLDNQNYFDGFLYPRHSSTGLKPLGRLKIGESSHLLTLMQLDDYGPVYYGLTYDQKGDRIISKVVIAQEWSDAGDTQIIRSNIKQIDGQLQITKQIETCHADVDTVAVNPEYAEVKCNDSTAIVVVNKQLNLEIIK